MYDFVRLSRFRLRNKAESKKKMTRSFESYIEKKKTTNKERQQGEIFDYKKKNANYSRSRSYTMQFIVIIRD